MNERDILDIIRCSYDHLYQLTNSYVFGWESDYFGVTKGTGYIYEIEVKISVSDFRADFKNKTFKHRCLSMANQELVTMPQQEQFTDILVGHEEPTSRGYKSPIYEKQSKGICQLIIKKNHCPNKIFYAVPSELVEKVKDIVPKYAGLISVSENSLIEIKPAPFLHKRKELKSLSKILLDKFYYGYLNQKNMITQLRRDIENDRCYYEPEYFEEKQNEIQLTIF
jgi:hypothetical protein